MQFGSPTCNPFITLVCNFRCPYCITRVAPDYDFGYDHFPPDTWIRALNNLEDVQDFIFNGGEPTLVHGNGFADIINALKPSRLVAIGTNGNPNAVDVLKLITPRADLVIDISLHPTEINPASVLTAAKTLRDCKHRVRIHTVTWPGLGVIPHVLAEQAETEGIEAFVQRFDGWYDGEPHGGMVEHFGMADATPCRTRHHARCWPTIYRPVAPNGDIYICHNHMYRRLGVGIIGNIFDGWATEPDETAGVACDWYGWCNPCDLPRRINVLGQVKGER